MDSRIELSEQIKKSIMDCKNFVVSGGAGSGKTYTLVETLNFIFNHYQNAKIACITYTKVAANEIKKRVLNKNEFFYVSTIHEFLWMNISNYQKNIKKTIIDMYNQNIDDNLSISFPSDFNINEFISNVNNIKYRDFRKINDGIISHDDVIKISYYMYKNYKKLCDITNDKFDYIFIDEYQDSFPKVIDLFLNELSKISGKKSVIGLFGDSMQNIYPSGIGNLSEYNIQYLIKDDNWRSSQTIVNLINKFRNDGLIQIAKGENKNYNSKCSFIYSNSKNFDDVKKIIFEKELVYSDDYKELYLTHNLIGNLNGCGKLFRLYSNKDKLIGENKDNFIKHLEKIEEIRIDYIEKRHYEILEKLNINIESIKKKNEVNKLLFDTFNNTDCTIEKMIDKANDNKIILKDDDFLEFLKNNLDLYEKLKNISYSEFINCYQYSNHKTPYSTQHGVKGEEYNNVVVILDNGRWNQYDYSSVILKDTSNSKYIRSLKILYVSLSRAKQNLCVFYYKPTSEIIENAKQFFGESNVFEIN